MPKFQYRAYDRNGRLIDGELDSPSREAVLETLRQRQTFPVDVTEGGGSRATEWWAVEIGGSRALRADHLQVLTRELATLVAARLPIDETLRILAVQPLMPGRCRRLVERVFDRVVDGCGLAAALSAEDGAFPDYYCRLIAAGEKSGNLETVLVALADYLDRGGELRSTVRSALVYPIVLLATAVVALAIVMAVLVPAIAPLFEEAGSSPPVVIATLAALQDWLIWNWPTAVAGGIAAAAVLLAAGRTRALRDALDRLAISMPVLGRLVDRRETARFAGTLAMLLKGGVPLLEAVRIAGDCLSNGAYRQAAVSCEEHLARGGRLSERLAESGLFGPLAVRLTAVGERTGDLPQMLARLAAIEETALERDLKRLAGLVAPLLTVFIGLFVGGIILSVMGAIVSLNDLALK